MAGMGRPWRPNKPQPLPKEEQSTCTNPTGAAEPARQSLRSSDRLNAAPFQERAFNGEQRRQHAQLCSRLFKALESCLVQQRHQKSNTASLLLFSQHAATCAETGDARESTSAVISFLKSFGAVLDVAAAVQGNQDSRGPDAEAARTAVSAVGDYCRATTSANALELLVQRHLVSCVCRIFRWFPQLAAPESAALREALSIAGAAAVTLHEVLGAEPRPKIGKGVQLGLQEKHRHHVLATGLAATQPKQAALMRALLISMQSLLVELCRARNFVAAEKGRSQAGADESSPCRASNTGTVGEASLDLLLLLLPLTHAQPRAAVPTPLHLRSSLAAGGRGLPCDVNTDVASTQESEADAGLRGPSPRRSATISSASLNWRRSPQEGLAPRLLRAATPLTPRETARSATDVGIHPVRSECLRCVEALLRLCGKELFPYWNLLLQYGGPRCLRPLEILCSSVRPTGQPGLGSSSATSSRTRSASQPERQQVALAPWLCELLGLRQQEQQELPWAFLVTADENTKVRMAALGCLCALLETPSLRQWPATAPVCMRCGHRALLMPADAWERVVWHLGFSGPSAGSGGPIRSSHSLGCPAVPARVPHSGGPGAYTSFSRTIAQVSRCAVLGLFSVVSRHLVGLAPVQRPALASRSTCPLPSPESPLPFRAVSYSSADAMPSSSTAEDKTLGVPDPPYQCKQKDHQLPPETQRALALAAAAVRALTDAVSSLPAGLLQPAVPAAAVRLIHPVVLLLVEALEQRRHQFQQPEAQQHRKAACCVCFDEVSEAPGHEWAVLSASAAVVALRAKAKAEALFQTGSAAPADTFKFQVDHTEPVVTQNTKQVTCGISASGSTKAEDSSALLGCPCGAPRTAWRFEEFAGQVLANGPMALRLVSPCLASLAALIGCHQRQAQIAEALIVPISSGAPILGPSCLAALLCRSIHSFAWLWCRPLEDQKFDCGLPQCTASSRQAPRDLPAQPAEFPSEASHAALRDTDAGLREQRLRFRCNSCERHGLALADDLFSALLAMAKRYPQCLLLLGSPLADGLKAESATTNYSGALGGPSCGQGQGPFLEMLNTVFHSGNSHLVNRAVTLAVEVLGAWSVPETGEAQDEPCGGPQGAEGCAAVVYRRPPLGFELDETMFRGPRSAMVRLLYSLLIAPVLPGEASNPSGSAKASCQEQAHPPGATSPLVSLPAEQLSSLCAYLCRLTHQEWQQLGLTGEPLLEVLRSLAVGCQHRGVRTAAAAALGAFASHSMREEQLWGVATNAARPAVALEELNLNRLPWGASAVQCLVLQLSDPLPDIRAAALCALSEAAATLQQKHQNQGAFRDVGMPTDEIWCKILEKINAALLASDKPAIAAAGLRAVGAVVPLVLHCQAHARHLPHSPAVAEGSVPGAEGAQATGSQDSREADNHRMYSPRDEVFRSLTLLEAVLKPLREEVDGGAADDAALNGTDGRAESSRKGDAAEGEDRPWLSLEASKGLKHMKLHWNACHSLRLIFSSPAASLLLASGSYRLLSLLWLRVCGCLRTSQLTKVRCHAAAALAAMAKLIELEARSERLLSENSPEPLGCERCTAQLLIAAWRAVAAAGKTTEASAFTEDVSGRAEALDACWLVLLPCICLLRYTWGAVSVNERPGRRTPLGRYKELLVRNLERLLASGLLSHSQKLLKPVQDTQVFQSAEQLEVATSELNLNDSRCVRESLKAVNCSSCSAGGHRLADFAVLHTLREAMESALADGPFKNFIEHG